MPSESYTQVLQAASDLNEVLMAAMAAGPGGPEWEALECYFADDEQALEGLPACRQQIINSGTWGSSALQILVVSILKPGG